MGLTIAASCPHYYANLTPPPGGVRASKKALAQCVEVSTGPPSGCHFFEETKTVRADHVRMTRVVQGRLGFSYTSRLSFFLPSFLPSCFRDASIKTTKYVRRFIADTRLERKRTKKQKHINRGLPTCGGTIKVNQKHNRGRGLPTCGGTIKVNQKHNRGEPANLWRNDRSEPTATETNRLSKATIRNRNICGRNRNICGIYLKRRRNIVSRLAG